MCFLQVLIIHSFIKHVDSLYLVHVVCYFSKPLFHFLHVFPLFLILKCKGQKQVFKPQPNVPFIGRLW